MDIILLPVLKYTCIGYFVVLVGMSVFFTTRNDLSDEALFVIGVILWLLWPLTLLVTTIAVVRKLVYDMLNKFKN